jgi:hypothetical protein
MLKHADHLARRIRSALNTIPRDEQPALDLVGLIVRHADTDPRYLVLDVCADTSSNPARSLQPSTYNHPRLASIGDPQDDAESAERWRAWSERSRAWQRPARQPGDSRPGGPDNLRLSYLGMLPTVARYLRRHLRDRVTLRNDFTILVVTTHPHDPAFFTTEAMNDQLPAEVYAYFEDRDQRRDTSV